MILLRGNDDFQVSNPSCLAVQLRLRVGIIHKKPKEGGISAVGGTGSIYTFYGTLPFVNKKMPETLRDLMSLVN